MILSNSEIERLNLLSKKEAVDYINDLKYQLSSNDLLTEEIEEELDTVLINHTYRETIELDEQSKKTLFVHDALLKFKQDWCNKIFEQLQQYKTGLFENFKKYGNPKNQMIISREQRNALSDLKAKYPAYIITLAEHQNNAEGRVIQIFDTACTLIRTQIDFAADFESVKSQVTNYIYNFVFSEDLI